MRLSGGARLGIYVEMGFTQRMRTLRPLLAVLFSLGACDCGDAAPRPTEEPPLETPAEDEVPLAANVSWDFVDPPAPAGALGLNLRASSDGLIATWVEPESHRVRFSRFDGSWSEPTTVVEDPKLVENWADFPRSEVGGDGAIYVNAMLQAGASAYAYEVRLWRSADAGATFEPVGLLHQDGTETEHGFVSMVPTDDGVRVFWLDGRGNVEEGGGATGLYSARVRGSDEGAVVERAVRVDEQVCDCCQTDAAVDGEDVVVVYRDRLDGEIRDISSVRMSDGRFSTPERVHRDQWQMAGCPVNGPAIGAEDGRMSVAWFTGAEGGEVKLAFADESGFGDPIVIDPRQPPGRVDVALVDGGAVVSWLARRPSFGEVRVVFVAEAGERGLATVVGRTGLDSGAGFPVLARVGEELYVGYRDREARLRVAHLAAASLPRQPTEFSASSDAFPPPLEVGATLPADATVLGADGESLRLRELAEGPLVVAFFARWCQPCREEMQALEAMRVAHPGWTVVAVSVDEGPAEAAQGVARSWGFGGRVLRDDGAAELLRVPPLPGTFAWNGGGLKYVSVAEVFDRRELEAALRPGD